MKKLDLSKFQNKAITNTKKIYGGTDGMIHAKPVRIDTSAPCSATSNEILITVDPNCKG